MSKCVSVIMAAYNGEAYISEAIASVLEQDYDGEVELIVVDDGSTDQTPEIAEAFDSVRVIRQSNTGQSLARNHGFLLSRGDYIVYFDQDDILAPNCISSNSRLLESRPDLGSVAGTSLSFRTIQQLEAIKATPRPEEPESNLEIRTYHDIVRGASFVPPSVCMFRREVIEALNGFRSFPMADDLDLYARAARHSKLGVHTQPLVYYRRHAENYSSNIGLMLDVSLQVMEQHRKDAKGNLEEFASIEAGCRHWIRKFGPKLPMEAFWAAKDLEFKKSFHSLSVWLRVGMPR